MLKMKDQGPTNWVEFDLVSWRDFWHNIKQARWFAKRKLWHTARMYLGLDFQKCDGYIFIDLIVVAVYIRSKYFRESSRRSGKEM